MKVVTKAMRAGYLRRNGVPYSENAELTEYFELSPFPGGGRLLLVTAVVEDPGNPEHAVVPLSAKPTYG